MLFLNCPSLLSSLRVEKGANFLCNLFLSPLLFLSFAEKMLAGLTKNWTEGDPFRMSLQTAGMLLIQLGLAVQLLEWQELLWAFALVPSSAFLSTLGVFLLPAPSPLPFFIYSFYHLPAFLCWTSADACSSGVTPEMPPVAALDSPGSPRREEGLWTSPGSSWCPGCQSLSAPPTCRWTLYQWAQYPSSPYSSFVSREPNEGSSTFCWDALGSCACGSGRCLLLTGRDQGTLVDINCS